MKFIYVKPEAEMIDFLPEENLMLMEIDLTASNVEGGFTERL